MSDTTDPTARPGEIAGWPRLAINYRTGPDNIADLLPPGIEPGAEANVQVGIYCVPVRGEPEYGVSTKVSASYNGMPGWYSLGLGIDQESAIFISQELNGQPKFPCSITYFRLGDTIEARCTHQGYTFLEFAGEVNGTIAPTGTDREENEWWIKSIRAVNGVEKEYDFPPHVIRVHSINEVVHTETVDAVVTFRDSPWDPIAELLPMRELVSALLETTVPKHRAISLEGPLDPIAFWAHADTIGGSRWPGERGGPRRRS